MTEPHRTIGIIYHYDLARALDGEPVEWLAIPVDLDAGRQGGNIANQAKKWVSRTRPFSPPIPLEEPCADTTSGSPATATPDFTTRATTSTVGENTSTSTGTVNPADPNRLTERLRNLLPDHEPQVRKRWPYRPDGTPVPTLKRADELTDDDCDRILAAIRTVEADVSAPFHPDDTATNPQPKVEVEAAPAPVKPDEGGTAEPDAITALGQAFAGLDPAALAAIKTIAGEAHTAGRPISVQADPTVRKWSIARALVAWATVDPNPDRLFECVVRVVDRTTDLADADTSLGALVGNLTIAQADRLHDMLRHPAAA